MGKRELIDAIWPHVDVDENHLHVLMSTLRKALGPSGRECLATVPGYGYRLIVTFSAAGTGHSIRGEPTVAILPLRNLTSEAPLGAVCVALAEDLAANLAARGGCRQFSGTGRGTEAPRLGFGLNVPRCRQPGGSERHCV